MDFRIVLKRSIAAAVSVFVLAVVVQFFVSCGSDYEKPSTTQTQSALISASTLKSWMDAGKVNGTGYDRVVILDVTDSATYATGHIPGALFLSNAEIAQDRIEGVGKSGYEILDGSKMDELIQKSGIDGNTTVVITSSLSNGPMYNAARVYFTFRYWGFSKNRIKVLNGLSAAWPYGFTSEAPAVASSTYSVRNNRVLRDDLRVSLAEMIDYAEGRVPNAIAIDVRGSGGSYAGVPSTWGYFSQSPNQGRTVFEGRIRGAKAITGPSLFSGTSVKPADQLIPTFTSVGLDSTKTAYVYCVKGYSSAAVFFVLDGVLGWPAAIYDGSWTQWGQLSGNPDMKGQLDLNSPWRTDISSRSDLVVYNYQSPVSAATPSTGLTVSGSPSLATSVTYTITISGTGTPDTFDWIMSGGTTTAGVAITSGPIALNNGVSITFQNTSGHALNDTWTFTVKARQSVEQFTADGSACWATYLASGSTINSSGGSSECTRPNSWDTDANRVEEEDRAYMQSGGSGGSGGGTSVPAGC